MFPFIKNLFTGVQAIEILMCDKLVWVKNSKSAKRILHLCPNVKNSVEFITRAWGIRSVRNTVQHRCINFLTAEIRSEYVSWILKILLYEARLILKSWKISIAVSFW